MIKPPEEVIELGLIRRADALRQTLPSNNDLGGVATYMLWAYETMTPVYCGTAKTATRLKHHLEKDDLANNPVRKTKVNMPLREFCLSHPPGWMGMSFAVFSDQSAAREMEQAIIARLGIKKFGGVLFNQRMSG